MKSIMHEASSLGKALEQGWLKAGQPQEFSVKVLEEPKKNFWGFTTVSAKVALFFEDRQPVAEIRHKISKKESRFKELTPREQALREQPSRMSFQTSEKRWEKPTKIVARREAEIIEPSVAKQRQPLWNDDMVRSAQEWLQTTLKIMELGTTTFTIEPQRWHLRITLSGPLYHESQKEKHMLASLATLLLETLKRQFKTGLRGHKIVLTHGSISNS